ncbi:MAG: tRNA (adenosine(37)-N6)-threonylcarbamoyltransferase complex ATPase subunit type 1 TsaE [Propionibacteriaceae bacterium]|jgi:tRNA threonylcarbamoyladenosine biosynthesis protein TsaE|nr:tRNA (adenosine(37)-N6)-threonylcarbamoyltransferase complex ATPase subunit type 1 TsaE [Propionibacteriaceae bacterium]
MRNVLAESSLADGRALTIVEAEPGDAAAVREIIIDAFSNRPPVKPTPPALQETEVSIAAALERGFGVLALVDNEPAGAIIVSISGTLAGIHRVSVRPNMQQLGVASAMIEVVLELLAMNDATEIRLVAREEFPQVVAWWERHGFSQEELDSPYVHLHRQVAIRFEVPTADEMRDFGERLASLLQEGDVVILTGDLGAGKTTLTQGIGAGLDAEGPIISPTFVLARVHHSPSGPDLVHVDAYRIQDAAELEDLDLPTSECVTVIEWGGGIAEFLADQRLEIDIRRSVDPDDETRWLFLTPIGERWAWQREHLEAL